MKQQLYAVLLAGGTGERLWPLSTSLHPKQFLTLNSHQSLLEDTIDRISLIDPSIKIWCVTTTKLEKKIQSLSKNRLDKIICEPTGRNTGPAIALACALIKDENPNSSIIFLPTDHYIPDTNNFIASIKTALVCSQRNNALCLLGIRPTFAATGYGYIAYDNTTIQEDAYHVAHFIEKPSIENATRLSKSPNMLWNCGIFSGTCEAFQQALRLHAAEMVGDIDLYISGKKPYDSINSISFDYAVLEKCDPLYVVPATFSWSDVGDLPTFISLETPHLQHVISHNAHNNAVHSKKKVIALSGVDNLCIVETDDTLLILPKDKAQDVKSVLALIKEQRLHELT